MATPLPILSTVSDNSRPAEMSLLRSIIASTILDPVYHGTTSVATHADSLNRF
jgi:hypothetical protein